ncbi:hypothetical protein KOR42_38380 [Thalassoglobus neptunius]|uniref:Bacterial type II secretion system protein I/J n=1 Tax=Thalassoglobus neptunius TaxID=1938619 RepID=A0A5C5WGG4_9PLAN|nr:hypothetical protein [Thalassoglobus neptunius]TWT49886.1 hypothetical protein KOR42_38380 [Thalassoglobus neptunius]
MVRCVNRTSLNRILFCEQRREDSALTRSVSNTNALRSGISLFEVVLALAIFLGATAVITQILKNGSTAAIRSQLVSEAVLRCERRLNEVSSGVLPAQSVQGASFDDDPNWSWTLNVTETGIPYLLELEMIVEQTNSQGEIAASYRLNRLLRDPLVFEEAALASEEEL